MRLIDADALKTEINFSVTITGKDNAVEVKRLMELYNKAISDAPTIQAEPIVRCTDCDDYVEFAYWFDDEGKKRDCHYCTFHSTEVHGDDFCSWAKRKEQTNGKTG